MAAQRKETGTQFDFSKALEIKDIYAKHRYTFRDDVFGVLATQEAPFTIDAATRNNLVNGNIADVTNQTWGQGMQLLYGVVSWNETAQGTGYYITDFTVGAVVKVARDYNTGPIFLIDALRAVPWLGAVINNKIPSYRWKAWQLFTATRPNPYNHWLSEAESKFIERRELIAVALPELPDAALVKQDILSKGAIDTALETFRTEMQKKGFTVAFPGNSYGVDVCFEKTPVVNEVLFHSYKFKIHYRLWWEFTTDPDFTTEEGLSQTTLSPIVIAVAVIIVVIIASAGAVWILHDAVITREEYVKYGVYYDKDGNIIRDSNGDPVIGPTESGSKEAPADFMAWVLPIIALIGAGVAAFVIFQFVPRRRREETR